MKHLLCSLLVIPILSCANIDAHFRKNVLASRPGAILIGRIESRSLAYRPFAAANLRESLRFEFFRHGFRAELLENGGPAPHEAAPGDTADIPGPVGSQKRRAAVSSPGREEIAALCRAHSADVCIAGSFSESETGDYADTTIRTLVSLQVYDRSGEKAGELRYLCDDTIADAAAAKTVAARLAEEILSRFP